MSTKIYDVYRIPKENDVLKELNLLKKESIQKISENKRLLKSIHVSTYLHFKHNEKYKDIIVNADRGFLNLIYEYIEHDTKSQLVSGAEINFNCSILYDNNYWYLKFFINNNWMRDIVNEYFEKEWVEDYHFQNQSDMSNYDISEDWNSFSEEKKEFLEKDWKEREKKWNCLLESYGNGNWRHAFSYEIFSLYDFKNLIQNQFYSGHITNEEKFSHLAYTFQKLELPK